MPCVNVPQIVYSNSWLNQTSTVAETNIFTPSGSGIFRITFGGGATSGSGDANIGIPITDSFGNLANLSNDIGSGTSAFDINTFSLSNSTPVPFKVTVTGTVTYDVYVVIEQLA